MTAVTNATGLPARCAMLLAKRVKLVRGLGASMSLCRRSQPGDSVPAMTI